MYSDVQTLAQGILFIGGLVSLALLATMSLAMILISFLDWLAGSPDRLPKLTLWLSVGFWTTLGLVAIPWQHGLTP